MLVEAAAPDAHHVHVRCRRHAEQLAVTQFVERAGKGTGRGPVDAAREDRHTVEHEPKEARAWFIRVGRGVEDDRAHTDFEFAPIQPRAIREQRHVEAVEVRCTEFRGPPQRGAVDDELDARPPTSERHHAVFDLGAIDGP